MRVYIVVRASVVIIIIIVNAVIIFSGNVILVRIVIVWICVGDFVLQSVKKFYIDGVSPHDPSEQFVNECGEQ